MIDQEKTPPTSIIAELVLSPRALDRVSLSGPLKKVLAVLHEIPDIEVETHAMGTNIACDNLDILLTAVKKAHNYLLEQGFARVVTTLKIDERRDKPDRTLKDKVEAVK